MKFEHIPVLYDDVMRLLDPHPGERYLDLTLGGAGHASGVAEKIGSGAQMVGFDRDPAAQNAARQRLAGFGLDATFIQNSFEFMDQELQAHGFKNRAEGGGFDLVLADFGLSSPQIDDATRGFSFQTDAPLDMRMSQTGETAAQLIARISASELADILYQYGDIRQSHKLAQRICERAAAGQMQTTQQLADVSCSVLGHPKPGMPHPATRVFQAIRIAVNHEFDAIDAALNAIPNWIRPGGRLAIISFHSGEDRRVKEAMRKYQFPCTCPPKLPVCICHKKSLGHVINKKPIEASERELLENSRARSAKLRAFLFD